MGSNPNAKDAYGFGFDCFIQGAFFCIPAEVFTGLSHQLVFLYFHRNGRRPHFSHLEVSDMQHRDSTGLCKHKELKDHGFQKFDLEYLNQLSYFASIQVPINHAHRALCTWFDEKETEEREYDKYEAQLQFEASMSNYWL